MEHLMNLKTFVLRIADALRAWSAASSRTQTGTRNASDIQVS